MQTNQAPTKPRSAQAEAILAALEPKTAFNRKAEPIRSIADTLLTTKVTLAEAKLYTPWQNEALSKVQRCLIQMCTLVSIVNYENESWKLGISTMNAFHPSDMLAEIDELCWMILRAAEDKGVQPILDNRAGASHVKAMRERYATLEQIEEETAAHLESIRIQRQQKEAV